MDRTSISRRIGSIKGDISKLSNTLCAIEQTDIENYPDNYTMLTTDAALRSELIACRMRHLLYGSTTTRKETYLASAGVVQGIRIKESDGVLEITLPCLIPKRKQRQSTEFLIDPLYFTLSQYSDSNRLPKFRQCVVCFSHVYSEEFFTRRVRDYDNLELKQLLDVLSTFIMEDDTGLLVDAYNTTEIGEADCTRISVMEKERFAMWITERENSLPDKQTAGYMLLELIAISGELPADQLRRLSGGDSYKLNVVRMLKAKKLLRTYYRDGLRGYRLTARAKTALCSNNPERFSFALTGSAETNLIKSEITRRLRLHRVAETTVTMMNAGVQIHRDEKPDVFSPDREENIRLSIKAPAFYNSREIKEMGTVFTKIRGASGSMKTRAYCLNRILQATVPGADGQRESLIICDPKSELYEKTSEFLRNTHTVN